MIKYKISQDQIMTPELIKKLINKHQFNDVPKFNKMDDYYHARNKILGRVMNDSSKPNNKVSHPYASYITDTLTGYFMGEGVTYSALDANAALDELQMVLEYNDSQDEDIELAKDMSIFGLGVELMYIDKEGSTRMRRIDPREMVLVYDDSLEEELLYGIRYYKCEDILTEQEYYMIEVYSASDVVIYKSDVLINSLEVVDTAQHYFNLVPVSVYFNNEEEIGDFEPVISLIDAYDQMESDSLNDFEYFVDAYLCLQGLVADNDDVAAMKENRILLLDSDSDAKWLIKDTNDTNIENVKTRLDADIHKFSKVPDMTDKAFGGNASGVAIKYKTLPMENIVAIKERKFKKGLQRRIELIFNIMSKTSGAYDWRSIDISFTRNLPTNDTEIASMVSTLSGIVSNETLLAQVPFVEDVDNEQKKVEKEQQSNPWYDTRLGLTGEDADEEARRTQRNNEEKK